MTYTQRFFHHSDTAIQTMLIVGAVVLGIMSPIFYFLLLFVIGIWQLSSALFRMIALRNFTTFTYFMSAVTYCMLLSFASSLLPLTGKLEMIFGIWFVCIVPTVGAVWYLQHCLQMIPQQNDAIDNDLVPERSNRFDWTPEPVRVSNKRLLPFQS